MYLFGSFCCFAGSSSWHVEWLRAHCSWSGLPERIWGSPYFDPGFLVLPDFSRAWWACTSRHGFVLMHCFCSIVLARPFPSLVGWNEPMILKIGFFTLFFAKTHSLVGNGLFFCQKWNKKLGHIVLAGKAWSYKQKTSLLELLEDQEKWW